MKLLVSGEGRRVEALEKFYTGMRPHEEQPTAEFLTILSYFPMLESQLFSLPRTLVTTDGKCRLY